MYSKQSESFYSDEVEELTLTEALRKHYLINPQFTIWSAYKSLVAQKLVKAHDISHIVFGCDTSLLGEMRVQLWAKFGVQSFGLAESLRYAKDKEAKVLLKNPVGYWAMFKFFIKHINEISKVRMQSKQMVKKWVYFDEHKYMEMTVEQIRDEFHIRVLAS
jgi:ubiquinone biosynthesis protein Coq4